MKKLSRVELVLYAAIALAALLSAFNVVMLQGRVAQVNDARVLSEELAKPAEIEAIKILPEDCQDCFDIETSLERAKAQNIKVVSEKTVFLQDEEAKSLISRYSIKKLPVLLISGELNRTPQLNSFFEREATFAADGVAVYDKITPPYYDISGNRVAGRVSVISLVDSSCQQCLPLTQIIEALKKSGVAITEEKSHEYTSPYGRELIEQLNVSRIPAILISSEIDYYDAARSQLQQLTSEKEGFYALHATAPPYRDLQQNKVVGLVKIMLLNDSSCQECYDVTINSQILSRFGVAIEETSIHDVSSQQGKEIVSKYGIEKVPVLLMSPEAKNYPALMQVWKSVGSEEDDGWYVMREPQTLGPYKNLKDGKTVTS